MPQTSITLFIIASCISFQNLQCDLVVNACIDVRAPHFFHEVFQGANIYDEYLKNGWGLHQHCWELVIQINGPDSHLLFHLASAYVPYGSFFKFDRKRCHFSWLGISTLNSCLKFNVMGMISVSISNDLCFSYGNQRVRE